MRYFEVNGLDAGRRVGYGTFNTDHSAYIRIWNWGGKDGAYERDV